MSDVETITTRPVYQRNRCASGVDSASKARQMARSYFTTEQNADLYEQWRLTKAPTCPDCDADVNSERQGRAGNARTRAFTCQGCGKVGTHIVPNGPPRPGEDILDPGPNKLLRPD